MTPKIIAPVILFVYNRPEHTVRALEALRRNRLAEQTDLYVFSDAPRSRKDSQLVDKVRKTCEAVEGFREVTLVSAPTNRGLATSIIDGVSSVVNRYGCVIVLEDDLLTSPYFLTYMNDALTRYEKNEKIMHVSGYMVPVETEGLPETFFLRVPSSWGWATWSRAWQHFEKNPEALLGTFSKEQIYRFNLEGACDFWEQVKHNAQGKISTWSIFWYASIFLRDGLCLYPSRSLVQNDGNDGSGQHCLKTNQYNVVLAEREVTVAETEISEQPMAYARMRTFYQSHRMNRLYRLFLIYLLQLEKWYKNLLLPKERNNDS